jgi:hypothetical protein
MAVAPPSAPNPYTDRAWLKLFWEDRDKAVDWLPDDRRPESKLSSPGVLAVGIIALVASPISLFAGVFQTVGSSAGLWDCKPNDPECESDREAAQTLGPLGVVGGLLGIATGISLTVVGATQKDWFDPDGNPIPTREELGIAQAPAIELDVAFGAGSALLRGIW